jgi:hypothetical protein
VVAISETCVSFKQGSSRVGSADKPVASSTLFNDWKRFCFVLREVASGVSGCALSGLEAQNRAQEVLNECGYSWPGGTVVREPVAAPPGVPQTTWAPLEPAAIPFQTKAKGGVRGHSRAAHRHSDPRSSGHRVDAPTNNGSG